MKGTVQDITERKQAEEVQEQRVRELAAINEVGRIVTASLSLDQVAQAAVDGIVATLAPDLAVVLFRDGDELRLLACGPDRSGFSREDIPPHVLGECLCGLALTESRPLYSYNIHNDPRCTWDECKRAGMRSFAALPLYGLERTIGVLGLASATECDYSKRATFLEALAAQVAAGLQNASLHGQVKNHAAELEQRVVERTAELQEANKELETFAYTVSHDLKAPLRGIDGYSRLLTQDYADVLDEEGKIFLHNIRNATSHMNQLIDDLLAYARLERRTLETSRLDPRSLVEALLAERAADLHGSSTTVSVDIPAITISADAEGLTQALRNLIDNAIKFTAGVPQPAIRVGACETDHGCVLWVRDNGIGFDMRYKDRIFEIFHRLHRAEDFPGTGIGLAIVRKAIESMNGCIWAESAPGKGAAFSLYLPK
jgi:signal transduction histidine kinase